MARPLRLEFAGAIYHVAARGNIQTSVRSRRILVTPLSEEGGVESAQQQHPEQSGPRRGLPSEERIR